MLVVRVLKFSYNNTLGRKEFSNKRGENVGKQEVCGKMIQIKEEHHETFDSF